MTSEEILDAILVPRPNGSEALERVAAFLADALARAGASVELHAFTGTPWGFRLCWSAALLLMLGYAAAVLARRFRLALAAALVTPLLLVLEFELLRSPVSGLAPALQHNVVGTFEGRPGGPLLVLTAHYDTTTHFGDHRWWGPWGWSLGPALGAALVLAWLGWRRGEVVSRGVSLLAAAVILVPFAGMAWFHAAGPLLRQPSPGALDNGGSVAALLRLAEPLAARPANAPTTVKLVFTAAEEERALGSWAFASRLDPARDLAVLNLESVGARGPLAYVPEDGFELRRYRSPAPLIDWVTDVAQEVGEPLRPLELPLGTLTDGRSFLARGIPALTLRATVDGSFPVNLHSARDSRERLSLESIERAVGLLGALVGRLDAEPDALAPLRPLRSFRCQAPLPPASLSRLPAAARRSGAAAWRGRPGSRAGAG